MRQLKADLHIHTKFSDGKLALPEVIDLYGKNRFDVIAITDHVVESSSFFGRISNQLSYSVSTKKFQEYYDQVSFEADRAEKQYGMKVLFGYEISKNSLAHHRSAHILVIGNPHLIDADQSVSEILQESKESGALTIAAHPFLTGEFEFQTYHLWSQREKLSPWIDAWEASYRKRMVPEVLYSGLPVIASSDFHNMNHFSAWRSLLSTTSTDRVVSSADVFSAIRNQNLDFYFEEASCQLADPGHFARGSFGKTFVLKNS